MEDLKVYLFALSVLGMFIWSFINRLRERTLDEIKRSEEEFDRNSARNDIRFQKLMDEMDAKLNEETGGKKD